MAEPTNIKKSLQDGVLGAASEFLTKVLVGAGISVVADFSFYYYD